MTRVSERLRPYRGRVSEANAVSHEIPLKGRWATGNLTQHA